MNEKCINCKYCHRLVEFSSDGKHIGSVCTFFPETEVGYDAFAIVVSFNGMCEMFTERVRKEVDENEFGNF